MQTNKKQKKREKNEIKHEKQKIKETREYKHTTFGEGANINSVAQKELKKNKRV